MLPDPQNTAAAEIVPDNIRAVQTIYAAWQLEEARVFAVVERLAALFVQGLLPLGRGRAADGLAGFIRTADRLTAQERTDLYAQALGVPGGDRAGESNRDFLSLWLRFVASVAMYPQEPKAPSCAAHLLAANASAHGGGLVRAAAERLSADVHRMFDILGDPELQRAYGARDAWQVIEQVSARDLGGARDVARHRTLSTAGSRILSWLADHANAESLDADLVDAVEQWLAASSTSDEAIESYATPVESPTMPSPRTNLPAMMRDLLDSLDGDGGTSNADPAARGRIAWFQGARRTGKTLAAHLVAAALSLDIYRIDLAAVVSKYIGETEKHLSKLFDDAEKAGAILLIDEADALFGKRGGVNDAHDRYANIDVAWLIQRIEAFPGLVILASNAADAGDEPCWRQRPRLLRFPRRGGASRST